MDKDIGAFAMPLLASYWWIVIIPLAFIAYKWVFRLFGIVILPQDSVGVINKKFVLFGPHRSLPDGSIIALHGEAGIQADTLAPGIHFGYWPDGWIATPSRMPGNSSPKAANVVRRSR
jgi:hypothetical protein